MSEQIIFAVTLLVTLAVFGFTVKRLVSYFKLTKPFPVGEHARRFKLMLRVALGQTKIFRRPAIGFLHALVFWGFCVILLGSIEMVIDGLAGTERIFSFAGIVYDIIIGVGDIFALIIAVAIIVFMFRRLFLPISRFEGEEMRGASHRDANFALLLIFLLMITLLTMNASYRSLHSDNYAGWYPVSCHMAFFMKSFNQHGVHLIHEISWWSHILLIFFFANYLPYSKHFHVFMSVPNVYLSRLDPLGKLPNMSSITQEVKGMLDGTPAGAEDAEAELSRFGVMDIEDVTWKNYFDSLSCTQCGRCTSVCPANVTGKKLSPRKVIMSVRDRMKEKAPGMLKEGKSYQDGKALLRGFITAEELWACTTCNACAQECPININQPTLIVDMRRYLVMEEAAAPGELNTIFSNIENNGAPWQFSPEDRLQWTEK